MRINYIFLLSIAFFLTGCGPIYKTFHEYNLPTSQEGKECVGNCQKMKQKCEKLAQREYQICGQKNVHSSSVKSKANKELDSVFSSSYKNCNQLLDREQEVCIADFNSCYELCGGGVETARRCVGNCK